MPTGRGLENDSEQFGLYEAVIGSRVAAKSGLKIGDVVQPTHGDPASPGSHLHETDFHIVGILDPTGTPNDRVLFLNMEGFFLMDGHTKSIEDESVRGINRRQKEDLERRQQEQELGIETADEPEPETVEQPTGATHERNALPIEQREVTSILIRTPDDDGLDIVGEFLPPQINQGDLTTTLNWSPFRPERSQDAAQAVKPIVEMQSLFAMFVDPVQSMLLALTLIICIVSAISILVGMYNSMAQRRHEIAVMRALGASRSRVMTIMLCESVLIALAACALGWLLGHGLNAVLGPAIEAQTGVRIGFFDLAPPMPLAWLPGAWMLPAGIANLSVSPELLLIPGLVLLAIAVGIYPAISAYRTDVAAALWK